MSKLLFSLVVVAVLAMVSRGYEIGAEEHTLFPGKMRGRWRIIRNADFPNGDHLAASLTVIGDSYAAMGVAYEGMGGPIVACHVSSTPADTVCKNVIGRHGGGIEKNLPTQTVKVLESFVDTDGFRTVTFAVPTSSMNLTGITRSTKSRLIFAHGTWDSAKNLPTYHGPANKTVVFSNLHEPISSPIFDVFPGVFSAQWRVQRNGADAGGDSLAITLRLIEGSGDTFQAIGFSHYSMHGPIIACHVSKSNVSASICKNYIGMNGGGIHHTLPPQTVKLLWASHEIGHESIVEFEVPMSALNFTSDPETTFSRLIFAHGQWDAASQRPTYHGPNATILHVNLYTNELGPTSAPVTTPWSFPQVYFANSYATDLRAAWHVSLNPQGSEASNHIAFYLSFDQNYWAIVGFPSSSGAGRYTAVSYQPSIGNPLTVVDIDVTVDSNGVQTWTPAAQQVSSAPMYMEMYGTDHIVLHIPLSRAPIQDSTALAFFGLAYNYGSTPTAANISNSFHTNFFRNDISTFRGRELTLLGGVMTAQWRLVDYEHWDQSPSSIEVTLSVVGDFDEFVGIGFSPKVMEGPIVACHVDPQDATHAECRDFIGQKGGGVKVNPEQATKLLAASHDRHVSSVTFITPLRSVNVTEDEAYHGVTRLIFAHGVWDEATRMPKYHGPNNCTIRHVNLKTGTPVAPPSAPLVRASSMAAQIEKRHKMLSIIGDMVKRN